MKVVARALREHETDHELVWLLVSLGCAGAASFWLHLGIPVPPCTLHELTGVPCPGCGSTRSVTALLSARWIDAFLWNPLVFLGCLGTAFYDVYAVAVLVLRGPRLRFEGFSPRSKTLARISLVTAVLANWAWLLHRGV